MAIELSDLLSKTDNVDDPNDKIHDNTDIFVNKKYYNELIHIIDRYNNDVIKIGDYVVVNNLIINYPMVFKIKPRHDLTT